MDVYYPLHQHDVYYLENWVKRNIEKYSHVLIQKGYGGTCVPDTIATKLRCTIKFQYIHNCIEYIYMVSTPRLQRLVRAEMIECRYRLVPITQSVFVAWMEERGSWHAHIKRTKEAPL